MTEFNYSIDSDGVAIISWDVPNKNMNVMSLEGLTELDKLFDQALFDDHVKGIILTSGKSDFAGGMDLNVLADMKTYRVTAQHKEYLMGLCKFINC